MNGKTIWLDMDGTIADLYGVDNWLDYLINNNPTPYEIANPLYNMEELLETLVILKNNGYKIGIISWLSKNSTEEYSKKVIRAKRQWLAKYNLTYVLDEIIITEYGLNKANSCREFGYGILVDDEERNRAEWNLGGTINANENIIEILKKLLTL